MSSILWCDSGGHPFSDSDPRRHRMHDEYTSTVRNPDTGQTFSMGQSREVYDICGECWEKSHPFQKPVPQELEANDTRSTTTTRKTPMAGPHQA